MDSSALIHQRKVTARELTEVEATPSQPPGALAVVQSPIVAACEPPLPDCWLLGLDGVLSPPELVSWLALPGLVPPVEGVFEVEEPEAEFPGCWHCQDGSGAQDPSSCLRHCAYAARVISRSLREAGAARTPSIKKLNVLHLLSSLQIHSLPEAHGSGPLMPWLG